MIAIIDYGMGNLRSVQKALEKSASSVIITQSAAEIQKADKVVLPGVGAMQPAMEKLNELDLIKPIQAAINSSKLFLGICLGFQLLFDVSHEGGRVPGLGIISGTVERFTELKVPHMGWNHIDIKQPACPIFEGVDTQSQVYFCHSFYAKPKDDSVIVSTTSYGVTFASAVARNNVFGVQFHPEKSQSVGLKIMENFSRL